MECVSFMFLVTIRSNVLSLNFKITVPSTCCKFWKDVSKFLILLAALRHSAGFLGQSAWLCELLML